MKIKVTLKFDDKNLGKKWMNIDNFKLLLYSKFSTLERLFTLISYQELDD